MASVAFVEGAARPRREIEETMGMTPGESRRLATVEAEGAQNRRDNELINGKLDQIIAAANMGKGAWWLLLRLGGALVVIFGALTWAADHWNWWK